jgi:O-antigen/teichoic acid export membrane protein
MVSDCFPPLIFVVAAPVVTILFSSSFVGAVQPLRWLLLGIFTLSAGKVLVAELLAREKPRYIVWAAAAAVVANIVGNFAPVPRMGISGAAVASSVSYTIMSSMLTVYGPSTICASPGRDRLLSCPAFASCPSTGISGVECSAVV